MPEVLQGHLDLSLSYLYKKRHPEHTVLLDGDEIRIPEVGVKMSVGMLCDPWRKDAEDFRSLASFGVSSLEIAVQQQQ